MTKTQQIEARQDAEATRSNRRVKIATLAQEIQRNGSSLMTRLEAFEQAESRLEQAGEISRLVPR